MAVSSVKKTSEKKPSASEDDVEEESETEDEQESSDEESASTDQTVKTRPEKVTERYSFKYLFKAPEAKKDVFYDHTNGNNIPYNLFMPDGYDPKNKYPIILFLHGAGVIGTDNDKQVYNLGKMFEYNGDLVSTAFVLCPQSDEWWNLGQSGTLTSALNLLNEVTSTYSCDKNRIYVTGLSMGGYATWDLLKNHGSIFAAGIPICGGGDSFSGMPFKDIPIRIYHGTADTTVPFSASKSIYDAILRAGGTKAKLISLEGVGHDAWHSAFTDRDTLSWLFAQNKATNPNCEYEYNMYFSVKDASGKTVICDKDVVDVSDEADPEDYTVMVYLHLSASGKRKLENAYTSSSGKPFTVYWGNQKLYSFTATEAPIDDKFCISKVFDYDNFYGFCDMVTRFNRTN